jgi:hypothetical protein
MPTERGQAFAREYLRNPSKPKDITSSKGHVANGGTEILSFCRRTLISIVNDDIVVRQNAIIVVDVLVASGSAIGSARKNVSWPGELNARKPSRLSGGGSTVRPAS